MDEFKKKLLQMGERKLSAASVICAVIAVFFLLIGLLLYGTEYEPFYGEDTGYSQAEIVYLMGPFAVETEGDETVCEYYIAETDEEFWVIVGSESALGLPVYGEDVFDDADIGQLTAQTVYGYSTLIPDELVPYLLEIFGEDSEITEYNYADYFGAYYLDMRDTDSREEGLVFFVLAGFMLVIAVVFLFSGGSKSRKTKKQIEEMESKGELNGLYRDFENGSLIFYKKLRIAVTKDYLINYFGNGGFEVIPLEHIVNVFQCNMVNGTPTEACYIALETAEGKRTLVAYGNRLGKEFNDALVQLKKQINGGAVCS